MELIDLSGRRINYLRLSVTDRCNFRCCYCMPPEGLHKLAHHDILSYEELLLIAESAVSLGIEKIRITGGEPLVRPGITQFIARLAVIPGLKHLALTTNAFLLEDMASGLLSAGIQRLNISLDSLDSAIFARITRGGNLAKVLRGIDESMVAGFPSPKINCVVMRGINDHEISDFARLSIKLGSAVRFIEYMPVLKNDGWEKLVVSGSEILERLHDAFQLEEIERGSFSGPSRDFRIVGGAGSIGVITPVSGHFCGSCNRIRVTSTGMAKGCLFADETIDLKEFTASRDRVRLADALGRLIVSKPPGHSISVSGYSHTNFAMAEVGG